METTNERPRSLSLPTSLAGRETLRARDLHDAFGISVPKVHALIKAGRIEALQLDGVVLLKRASVEKYLATARPVEKK